ncbi:peptidoglycan DD-metalloendopeptidase family protein [Paenibacillus sp.]|uniref:murein hydrolase activator EnvC family protein n=1 Tax=Paenibacillus sp. TaxID=58172 RepID=UPI00281ED8CC|nr:peptidoglycan DD-metalloendopeptidase family protein [Paenibacillus sp.]MDR0267672.1 peptidoglycan DD-metalloendopeptidase family protein [Paenibacillus sp.]
MKRLVSVLAVILLVATVFQPTESNAKKRTVDQIEHEMNVLQQQAQAAKKQQAKAEAQKQEAQHYKNKTQQNLQYVLDQIDQVSNTMMKITMQIEQTQGDLRVTASELDAAEDRIQSREKMLESRVRLMYTDGSVSYLEVLLSATSFSDFLERADSLKSFVDQDKDLLDQHKKDKALVLDKKKELEGQYAKAKNLYADMEDQKVILDEKEKEKQVMIAQYDHQIDESDDISDEQNAMLISLASKRSELQTEKNKLKAEEAARRAAAIKAAAAKKAAAARKAATAQSKARPATGSVSTGGFSGNGGPMYMPVSGGRISSGYGRRTHPVTGEVGKMHTGVDLAVPQGTPIHAADEGTVTVAEWMSGYGYCVIVDHGGGMWTLYGHIRQGGIKVKVGDHVSRGQVIAQSGATGRVTGPHLHFEVRENGNPVNPMPYL